MTPLWIESDNVQQAMFICEVLERRSYYGMNSWFVLKQHNFTNKDILAISAQNYYHRQRQIDEMWVRWIREGKKCIENPII